jgi:hypothetical protein
MSSITVTNKFTCPISVYVNSSVTPTVVGVAPNNVASISGFNAGANTVKITLNYPNPPMLDASEVTDSPSADFSNFSYGAGEMTFTVTLDANGCGAVTGESDPDMDAGKDGIPPSTED